MILNKYISTNLFLISLFCLCGFNVSAQNQTILIFDPHQVSSNFQNSFHQLSSDSIHIVNTLDENINNFDALFLFMGYSYVINQEEGNKLINYLQNQNPIYIYTNLFAAQTESVDFWKFIGLDWYTAGATVVQVDSVVGVDSEFTIGVSIDTSFWYSAVPFALGNLTTILIGQGNPLNIDLAYISGYDSIKIIVDQFYQIHHTQFLETVLIYFGLKEPTNIIDDNTDQPNTFYLHQNYPNPFNPTTTIKFTIPPVTLSGVEGSLVTLKVYDVLGTEITVLVNEESATDGAGSYEVEWDASRFSSGIYFYQINAGSFIDTKKMLLLR